MRRVGSRVIDRIARRRIQAFLAAHPADVIVSTYPITTELFGRMRRAGFVGVPVVSAITDLAALNYWAHPGVDLHLITHPESEPEVRAIAGAGARVEAVHGLTDLRFTTPPPRAGARAALGLAEQGRLVVVSGGGWGVGDLRGATDDALIAGASTVIILVGHNEGARARLQEAYAADPRVQVWGFTDRMVTLLAAATCSCTRPPA
jgi:UDP-N-acetylglucosamine:LPS N-acetylglucosamine transferase